MTTNGTHPPFPNTDVAPGDIFLELNEEGKAALADLNWLDEQYDLGAFAAYRGEYVAAVGLKVLGHGKNLIELFERVSRESGFPKSRIATVYVDEPFFTE